MTLSSFAASLAEIRNASASALTSNPTWTATSVVEAALESPAEAPALFAKVEAAFNANEATLAGRKAIREFRFALRRATERARRDVRWDEVVRVLVADPATAR